MKNTTLCYLRRGDEWLMLHRDRKPNDENAGKWIGVGGKFENGESPEDCLLREVREETGLQLLSWHFHGVVTFVSDRWECEYMFLYTADEFSGGMIACDEGELEWVTGERIGRLPLWEGDRIFLDLIKDDAQAVFSLKLVYRGDVLTDAVLNGVPFERGVGIWKQC